jgi:kinesin family protein 1
VRDLLSHSNPPGGLKVRQHPKHGFVVSGLHKVAVSNYEQVEARMEAGTIARTTASTQMNETSSRSHMVITVHLKQV